MKGLLAFSVLSALPALASVQSALSANVLPSSANLSSYSITLAELKAADVACEEGWAAVDSASALAVRGRELRAGLIAAVGGFPETRCALNAQTVATVQRDGYKVEKVLFESWPGVHVTANFFLPDNPSFAAPYPAVILPCGHSTNGKGSDAYQRGCVLAAKAGLACLIYDPFDQGERYQTSRRNSCADHNRVGALAALLGGSMARFRIWDGMRAIDYLESRPDVDSSRIGCMGNSGGGTMTSLLMAVEPRLKAACPSSSGRGGPVRRGAERLRAAAARGEPRFFRLSAGAYAGALHVLPWRHVPVRGVAGDVERRLEHGGAMWPVRALCDDGRRRRAWLEGVHARVVRRMAAPVALRRAFGDCA